MSSRSKSSSKSAAGSAPSPKMSAAASPSAIAASPSPAAPAASSSSSSSSAAAASSATLQVFWDLAKEEAGERAAACQLLLSSLAAEQQSYLASGGAKKAAAAAAAKAKQKAEDSMDDDDDDGEHEADAPLTNTVLPTSICPSLAYALKRLTRGLASSRAGARQGFALALTEILTHFPVVQTEDVLNIVADQIKLSAKANKQETRDYHLGRVFFALVLVRSGRVLSLADASLSSFVREMIEYAKGHLPIREVSYETVIQLLRKLPWKQWENSPSLRAFLLAEVANQQLENLSIEQVGLSVALKDYYADNMKDLPSSSNAEDAPTAPVAPAAAKGKDGKAAEAPKPLLVASSVRKLLSSKYLPQLHTAMFSSMQHYATADKLHSTWTSLILSLWRSYTVDKFETFWRQNVDEALFGGSTSMLDAHNPTQIKSTSYQKKFIGFQIVGQVLALLPQQFALAQSKSGYAAADALLSTASQSQVLSLVFRSRNFMRTLINNLSSKKNILFHAALALKKSLLRFGAAQPGEILTIVSALEDASAGGHMRFDSRTNSDTVLKLLEGLDAKGVQTYVDKLVQIFIHAVPVAPTPADAEEAVAAAAAAAAKKKGGKKAAAAETKDASASAAASAMDSVDSAELAQQSLDSTRQFCVDQLFALARNKNLPHSGAQEGSWLHRILQFFLWNGFCDTANVSKASPFPESLAHPVSEKVQTMVADKLFHLLNELLPHAPVSKRAEPVKVSGHAAKRMAAEKKKAKAKAAADADSDAEMEDADEKDDKDNEQSVAAYNALFSASSSSIPWALRVHQDWSSWTSGKKPVATLVAPLSKEQATARTASLDFINGLRERYEKLLTKTAAAGSATDDEKTQLAQLRSLQLLLLHLSLLLLKADERDFAAPLLEEVEQGVTELFDAKKKPTKKKAAAAAEPERPEFINVLVDILLSLLIRPSNLFRDISRSVFASFASSVNADALDDLMQVLRKKDKAPGAEGDDEDEDSDNFPSEDEEEAEEDNSKRKKAAPRKGQGKRESALDEEAAANAKKFAALAAGSDDDSDDEEMLDIDGLNKVFASKAGNGLDDLDSEDENNLDAAASYDAHLSNIVRLRNERKTAHKEFAQQSLHFKLRVCDLLEVFLRTQQANPLVLDLFLPTLLAIDAARGNKDAQQLQQKLVTLYKKMCGAKEHPTITADVTTQVRELQTLLMKRAKRSVHRETLHLTNLAILFLTKITIPSDVKAQVEATEAALKPAAAAPAKGKKAAAAAAPAADSAVSFVLNLYRTELVQYISVKHSLLNTKFFETFCTRFPGLAWSFVGPLSEMAQAKLPSESAAAHPYAANAFLRNDCFILLGTIFNNRHVLKDHDGAAKFAPFLPAVQEAIRSTIVAATLPTSAFEVAEEAADNAAKMEIDSDDDEDDAEAEKEAEKKADAKADKAGLSEQEREAQRRKDKKEREKLKARAKKKRREQRKKEAARLAGLASGPSSAEAAAKAAAEAAKSSVVRLKTMLKFANQAAQAFAPAQATGASPVCSDSVQSALSSLPALLATPLKTAVYNFLASARVDKDKLPLQIDDELLAAQRSKPNPNQAKAKDAKKDGKKAAPAAANGKATTKDAKKPAANGKSAASPKPAAAKDAGKKRAADSSSSSDSAAKKQKTSTASNDKAKSDKKKQ